MDFDITLTPGEGGITVSYTVAGCETYAENVLTKELQATGWRVTYTEEGCQDA